MVNSETYTQRLCGEMSKFGNWEWTDEARGLVMGVCETEAEARADMLIKAIEMGHLTAEEANQRLLNV